MIRPDYFARLNFTGISFEAVVRHYVDWLLGLGEFERLRQRRLAIGILPAWAAAELSGGADLDGNHGCRAVVLHRPSGVRIGLVHADERNPGVFWHSVALITRAGDTLLLEHAVGRKAPQGMLLARVATSPAVLIALLDRDGLGVAPPELRLAAPVTLGVTSVPRFASSLLGRSRAVSIALVAPQLPELGIDVTRLARSLRSIAMVACLADAATFQAFNAELDGRAFSALDCTDGGVRLYFPIPEPLPSASHPSWPPQRIRRFHPRTRTTQLAAEIIGRITERTLPAEFFAAF